MSFDVRRKIVRFLTILVSLLFCSALIAESSPSRYFLGVDGSLNFGEGLNLPRLSPDGEWRYFGAQGRAGRELLRFSFERSGLREVTVDLSYTTKPSSGLFEKSRISGFLTGFCIKEGLLKGQHEKKEMTLAGSPTLGETLTLSGKTKSYYFASYLLSRSPHTTVWILTDDEARTLNYQALIEKL